MGSTSVRSRRASNSAHPRRFEWLEQHGGDWLEPFIASDSFWQRSPLLERLTAFVGERLPEGPARDIVRFESALLSAKADPRVDEIGDEQGEVLVASDAFFLHVFDHDVQPLMDAPAESPPKCTTNMLIGARGADVISFPIDDTLLAMWRRLATGPVSRLEMEEVLGSEHVESLLAAGVVTAWTAPR